MTEKMKLVWIQSDHLEKAKRAPFLCRVEPTQRLPDFVAMAPADQLAQARRELLDEVIECVRTVGGQFAVDCERMIRALPDE